MTTGTVKFFNAETGFGVVSSEQAGDVFVHVSYIQSANDKTPEVGQQVEFDVGRGRTGDEAHDVASATDRLAAALLSSAILVEGGRIPRVRSTGRRAVFSAVEGAADGVARLEGRGFVASYGQGRRCAAGGCPTTLSRYNRDALCSVHSPRGGSGRS
jgi:CspA family cold shock protein